MGNIQITSPQELISRILREAKFRQKEFLTEMEKSFGETSYEDFRKAYLDNTNDIVRGIVGVLLGQEFTELFNKKG